MEEPVTSRSKWLSFFGQARDNSSAGITRGTSVQIGTFPLFPNRFVPYSHSLSSSRCLLSLLRSSASHSLSLSLSLSLPLCSSTASKLVELPLVKLGKRLKHAHFEVAVWLNSPTGPKQRGAHHDVLIRNTLGLYLEEIACLNGGDCRLPDYY